MGVIPKYCCKFKGKLEKKNKATKLAILWDMILVLNGN